MSLENDIGEKWKTEKDYQWIGTWIYQEAIFDHLEGKWCYILKELLSLCVLSS